MIKFQQENLIIISILFIILIIFYFHIKNMIKSEIKIMYIKLKKRNITPINLPSPQLIHNNTNINDNNNNNDYDDNYDNLIKDIEIDNESYIDPLKNTNDILNDRIFNL